jgi:hypothetical protein
MSVAGGYGIFGGVGGASAAFGKIAGSIFIALV